MRWRTNAGNYGLRKVGFRKCVKSFILCRHFLLAIILVKFKKIGVAIKFIAFHLDFIGLMDFRALETHRSINIDVLVWIIMCWYIISKEVLKSYQLEQEGILKKQQQKK